MLTKADLGARGLDVTEMLSELAEQDLEALLQRCALTTTLKSLGLDPEGTEDAAENYRVFCEGIETVFEIEVPASARFKTIGDAVRFANQGAPGA